MKDYKPKPLPLPLPLHVHRSVVIALTLTLNTFFYHLRDIGIIAFKKYCRSHATN